MIVPSNLIRHSIVLVVDKRERGIGMEAFLTKAGYRTVLVFSLYEALKVIDQEMPHLVVTESILSDGSAGTLYDRLQQHETLRKTPILVNVLKKTREELAPLAQRRFAGFLLGAFDPRSFLAKVHEIMAAHANISPYFMASAELGLQTETLVSVDAQALGRCDDQLVMRSSLEIDPTANMLCSPAQSGLGPVVLRMASNLREGNDHFNLFPLTRLMGSGRKWVMELPEIKLGAKTEVAKANKVLFYEPSDERFEGFRTILQGYGIDLMHAKSVKLAASLLKRDPEGVAAVYLHELVNDAGGVEWKNAFNSLAASQRPPLIVGTSSLNAKSNGMLRYIKRPFGLGVFVEMLQSAFMRSGDLAEASGSRQAGQTVLARLQAQAELLGLDETGGILRGRFPFVKGSRVGIEHAFLSDTLGRGEALHITEVAKEGEVWFAKFDAIPAGTSKVKYWERLTKSLSDRKASA